MQQYNKRDILLKLINKAAENVYDGMYIDLSSFLPKNKIDPEHFLKSFTISHKEIVDIISTSKLLNQLIDDYAYNLLSQIGGCLQELKYDVKMDKENRKRQVKEAKKLKQTKITAAKLKKKLNKVKLSKAEMELVRLGIKF